MSEHVAVPLHPSATSPHPLSVSSSASSHRLDPRLKSLIRRLRFFLRSLCFISATISFITTVLALGLEKQSTSTSVSNQQSSQDQLWGIGLDVWPHILVAVVSGITMVLCGTTIIAYIWSVEYANRSNTIQSWFHRAWQILQLILWIISTGLFRIWHDIQSPNDLWKSACFHENQQNNATGGEPNYQFVCNSSNVTSWVGWATVGIFAVSVLVEVIIIPMEIARWRMKRGEERQRKIEFQNVETRERA